MKKIIERLLTVLFPPRLPGRIRDWEERIEVRTEEQGWAGNVREHYKDAIQRHWEENPRPVPVRLFSREYILQTRRAAEEMAALERELTAQGFVNTIHDCWEPNECWDKNETA